MMGGEDWSQKVPFSPDEMADVLRDRGSEKRAQEVCHDPPKQPLPPTFYPHFPLLWAFLNN